jgi:hypothetical protein
MRIKKIKNNNKNKKNLLISQGSYLFELRNFSPKMHSGRSTIIRKSKNPKCSNFETSGTPTSHHKQQLLMA